MIARVPVLTFHDISSSDGVISLAPALFERMLATLTSAGWRCLGLEDLAALLTSGRELPGRTFCITFDDGFQSVYENALPVLQRLGLTATVFVLVGDPEEARTSVPPPVWKGHALMSWSQLRDLHGHGISLGAHTLSHPDLTLLTPQQVVREALGSRRVLAGRLDVPETAIVAFAYPYGRSNAAVRALLRPHFACACSDYLGFVTARSDVAALPRLDSYYLRHPAMVDLMPGRWLLPYIMAVSLPRLARRALVSALHPRPPARR